MPTDDLDERFDLCDATGRPLGRSKPRGEVHRDGDWHRSVHVWVVLDGETPSILFQRRSLTKDSHPGEVDVSVAGHLRAGESTEDAFREVEEEIGLPVEPTDVVALGVRRRVDARGALLDRELQAVFCTRTARSLESLRPDPSEVAGLLAVGLEDARRLLEGTVPRVDARELLAGERVARRATLLRTELLEGADSYFVIALASIARWLAREAVSPWSIEAL